MSAYNERLFELRKARGLNQTMAAAFLGVDQSTISRIESGDQAASMDQVIQLCELYHAYVRIDPLTPRAGK